MKRTIALAALSAVLLPSAGLAASEEPYWQQNALAGDTAGAFSVLSVDAGDTLVGRLGSKASYAEQDVAGLVMQWTQNVWLTATGGFNEEGTAVSGEVKLHLGF